MPLLRRLFKLYSRQRWHLSASRTKLRIPNQTGSRTSSLLRFAYNIISSRSDSNCRRRSSRLGSRSDTTWRKSLRSWWWYVCVPLSGSRRGKISIQCSVTTVISRDAGLNSTWLKLASPSWYLGTASNVVREGTAFPYNEWRDNQARDGVSMTALRSGELTFRSLDCRIVSKVSKLSSHRIATRTVYWMKDKSEKYPLT